MTDELRKLIEEYNLLAPAHRHLSAEIRSPSHIEELVKQGIIDDDKLSDAISKKYNLPKTNLDEIVIPVDLIRRVPKSLIDKYCFVPIHYSDDTLTIAIAIPDGLKVVEPLQISMNCMVNVTVGRLSSVRKIINSSLILRKRQPSPIDELKKFIIDSGLIGKENRRKLLDAMSIYDVEELVQHGMVNDYSLADAISKRYNLEKVDLAEVILPENLIRRIPSGLITKFNFIPLSTKADELTIAICTPEGLRAAEPLQIAMGCIVIACVARLSQVVKAMKSMESILAGSESKDDDSLGKLQGALIPLLIEKKVITKDELINKARLLGIL